MKQPDGSRQITGVATALAAIAAAGDPRGAAERLSHYADQDIPPESLYTVAEALARAGEVPAALSAYARADRLDQLATSRQETVALQLMQGGDYRLGFALAEKPVRHSPYMTWRIYLQTAAEAGDVDFVVEHLSPVDADSSPRLAAACLDAGDPAGAVKILRRALACELAGPFDPQQASHRADIVQALAAAGDKADALAAVRLFRTPVDVDSATTRPASRPATRPATQPLPYLHAPGQPNPDAFAAVALARVQVLCGDLDGALAWIATLDDPQTRFAAVAAAADAILYGSDPTWSARSLLQFPQAPGMPSHPIHRRRATTARS